MVAAVMEAAAPVEERECEKTELHKYAFVGEVPAAPLGMWEE